MGVSGGVCILKRFGFRASCFGFLARALAGSMPKFEGVSLFESLVVSAVGAKARERKVHLAVELEFLGDDFKGSGTLVVAGASMGTTNHFFRDGVLYIFDVVGEVVWGFGYLVVLDVGVAPAVSFFSSFFFGEGEVFLGNGLVVCEGREFWWEEFAVGVFPSFSIHIWHGVHVLDNAWY